MFGYPEIRIYEGVGVVEEWVFLVKCLLSASIFGYGGCCWRWLSGKKVITIAQDVVFDRKCHLNFGVGGYDFEGRMALISRMLT